MFIDVVMIVFLMSFGLNVMITVMVLQINSSPKLTISPAYIDSDGSEFYHVTPLFIKN